MPQRTVDSTLDDIYDATNPPECCGACVFATSLILGIYYAFIRS